MVVESPYDAAAGGWDAGPAAVYRPLARVLVASSPVPLAGARVVDVGSGTGAVAAAAAVAGAHVVATDVSRQMLASSGDRMRPVVADVVALPFGEGVFDAALAGFVVNHLAPARALEEMIRVVRSGGVVIASTWSGEADPVKSAVDEVLARWGWVPPDWYRAMKDDVLPVSGDAVRLASIAEDAGLVDVVATARAEDVGVRDPRLVVAYRLAVPQVMSWVRDLSPEDRAQVGRDAAAAVAPLLASWRPSVIVLTGRVAGRRRPRHAGRLEARPRSMA